MRDEHFWTIFERMQSHKKETGHFPTSTEVQAWRKALTAKRRVSGDEQPRIKQTL